MKASAVKSQTLKVRTSASQRRLLDRASSKEEMETSTWVRQLALKRAKEILKKR